MIALTILRPNPGPKSKPKSFSKRERQICQSVRIQEGVLSSRGQREEEQLVTLSHTHPELHGLVPIDYESSYFYLKTFLSASWFKPGSG